ncbi:MAG: hypothetical protein IH936_11355 [Acidobacteria bacterium]|nr:hypothetical protein [Acidobacteriota bacterium]
MGIEAITSADNGRQVVPETGDDWCDWVSATHTRRHILGDPVLDWLDLYGDALGFERDSALPHHDPRTDFTEFIFEQGRRFEEAVVSHLLTLSDVTTISSGRGEARELAKAEETFAAIREGLPVIYQGVLRDPQHRMYGTPDILVRSDVLRELFSDAISAEEAALAAPALDGAPWHYRVVDIKFRMLGLSARGELNNSSSAPAYKVQLFVYNRALGRLQGFEPPTSYLLGRGWRQRDLRGSSCMGRLAAVPQAGTLSRGRPISEMAAEAAEWVRRVRTEGADWGVLPEPSVPELYPNLDNAQDGPWHGAKRRIAEELEDLTLLWWVTVRGRQKGHEAGVYRWTDLRVTPELVGVTGEKHPHVFEAILDINRTVEGPVVRPARIRAAEEEWREPPLLEFYVDFETVSDLADDFSRIPEKGGETLIFMIGCGHVEDGGWEFKSFIVDTLAEGEEARIIDEWLAHMDGVRERLDPGGPPPMVIHWSPAEVTFFDTAYNSAKERHAERNWPSLRWFDFLGKVMREEPVVVRGAMGFGLKAIAKAMHGYGLIETLWGEGPTDGLGAMVGAWWCQDEAVHRDVAFAELDLMREIVHYNEVDCRVMMEVISLLRKQH